VPQGSHLCPLFCIADITDVLDIFENVSAFAYADDRKLYMHVTALTIVVCFSRTWTVYMVDVARRSMT
jgi:hypothetical protein